VSEIPASETPGYTEILASETPGYTEILERLEELGMLDREFLEEFTRPYLEDTEKLIGDLGGAISRGDPGACERHAHRLKGASLNLGAERLGKLAAALEEAGRRGDLAGAGPILEALEAEFGGTRAFLLRLLADAERPA
jgi:HPt (histidine-containing phosphotransfer) domain-containing protein